jgi:energy-coupling factor transporter ATP-binding protein EcfA2
LSSELRRPDGEPVLRSIDLTLVRGEVAGLIGSNGAGKTTLMRTLLGIQKIAGGSIAIGGKDSSGWTIAQRARQIGYVAQNLRRMFFLLSVVEEVEFSLSGGDTGAKAVAAHRDRAMELLGGVGLADRAEVSPFTLSNREQLMLALVCIEATQPSVVILDEPLIACDRESRAGVLAFLNRCRARGCAALFGLARSATGRSCGRPRSDPGRRQACLRRGDAGRLVIGSVRAPRLAAAGYSRPRDGRSATCIGLIASIRSSNCWRRWCCRHWAGSPATRRWLARSRHSCWPS